ncbi:hypothetical protein BD410DRAFT_841049 [Rickenella mellea]|uniref:DUF6533 domain-containing protein n=1 Tax=Rickenella mellea TaxID=50990 RepID=A0A4Y7Q0K4_9AGAM|nr:hypothetical protein BD410DRAFT_841049 [Rickenella mellea]
MADPVDIATLASLYPQFFVGSCTILSSAVIVFYDYALTFLTEISVMWKSDSRFNGAQALFFIARYSYIIAIACELALKFGSNNSDLMSVSLNSMISLDSCSALFPDQFSQASLSLVFSITVFILTFAKTYRNAIEMRKVDLRNGLAYYVLRDGTLYFLVNMLVSVSAIITTLVPNVEPFWSYMVVYVGNAVIISLISRLVLNLRQVSHMQVDNVAIRTIELEPEFATNSLIGNLGAPLRVGAEEEFMEETQEYDVVPDTDIF